MYVRCVWSKRCMLLSIKKEDKGAQCTRQMTVVSNPLCKKKRRRAPPAFCFFRVRLSIPPPVVGHDPLDHRRINTDTKIANHCRLRRTAYRRRAALGFGAASHSHHHQSHSSPMPSDCPKHLQSVVVAQPTDHHQSTPATMD